MHTILRTFPRLSALLLGLSLVSLTTGCDKSTVLNWSGSIKKSHMNCNFRGMDIWEGGGGTVESVDVHCYFDSSAGGGEHPYVLVHVSGCSPYRINGPLHGDAPLVNLSCVGDPFSNVGFQACQTHGGPLPDDCTKPTDWYDLSKYD